jgi:hypothetical protein
MQARGGFVGRHQREVHPVTGEHNGYRIVTLHRVGEGWTAS